MQAVWRQRRIAAGSIVVTVAFKPDGRAKLDRLCADFGLTRQDVIRYLVSAAFEQLEREGAA